MTADPRQTISVTERRPAVRRVPRADAADLAARFRHVAEILPTADRDRYRVTARGYVGWFRTATVRWVVRPKLPWADLAVLAGADPSVPPAPAGAADIPAAFIDLVAGRLAALMRERADAGLVRGYREQETESPTVRGRILFDKHLRQPALPGLGLPVVADEFTPDVPWNRVPFAAARRLLAAPGLSAECRSGLERAAALFAGVGTAPPTAADFAAVAEPDPRIEGYGPLVAWARLILGDGDGPADRLLLNLEHLFEAHVTRVLARPGRVEAQASLPMRASPGPDLLLRPDLLVRGVGGSPVSVRDVKWKRLGPAGPDPDDAHQALAYAAAAGARRCGLIYPGRRFRVRTLTAPSGVTLQVVKVPIRDLADPSAARLRRLVLRGAGGARRADGTAGV